MLCRKFLKLFQQGRSSGDIDENRRSGSLRTEFECRIALRINLFLLQQIIGGCGVDRSFDVDVFAAERSGSVEHFMPYKSRTVRHQR